jgi:superfamily II DNA helicase RecQ
MLFLKIKKNFFYRNRIINKTATSSNNFINKSKEYELHQLEMLRRMEQFLTTTSCRRYLILSYFDKNVKHPGFYMLIEKGSSI